MKNGISRRFVLKGACAMAGAALVPVGYSFLGRSSHMLDNVPASWVLATNQVTLDADLFVARIAESTGLSAKSLLASVSEVAPGSAVRQDLTLVRDGQVLDLSKSSTRYPELSDFMASIRERRAGATHFVHVGSIANSISSSNSVDFLVDGELVESLSATKNYQDIPIPGRMGVTHFRLEGGALSVAKSSCKHKTCEQMAAQSRGSIVCAPNRVVARLPQTQLVDAITA
jgi:hypothetical protein